MRTGGGVATVLIVDDEQSLRSYMARVLESEGYAVLEAENGVEALSLLSRKDAGVVVDLVITDVRMPVMGGRALAASLAKDRTSPPVLFVSGSHMSSDVSGPLLKKPFMPDDLSALARELLQIPPGSSSYEQSRAHLR
jgi:two-component system, cell cycle sensor histidine kinase and response regulator CckA